MNGCGWFGREICQGMGAHYRLMAAREARCRDRLGLGFWGREGVEGVEEWWSRAALDPSLIRSLAPSLLHLSLSLSLVVVVVLFCSGQAWLV